MRKLLLVSSNTIHTYKYLQLIEDYFDEILLITNKKLSNCHYSTIELSFSLTIKNLFSTVNEISRQIDAFGPTIIHIHQANSFAFYSLLANRKKNIPTILTAWGSDILLMPKKNYLFKKIVQYNLRNADFLTSDSVFMANEMKNLAQIKHHILIANFGIDVNPKNCEKENIVYSNRLHKKIYRIDKIIDAFFHFKKNRVENNWRLIIAATGTETQELKEKVNKLGLSKNVEFVGWVSKEENEDWYSRSKIWISIPESDATSISLLEAMACGCIPVVSDLPANREWIKSGENGLIIENLNEDYLSDALKIDALKVSQLNEEIIRINGTKQANKKKFIRLYDSLLKQ